MKDAASSGSPKRPAEMLSSMKSRRESSVGCSRSSICHELIWPGATQFTVTLRAASDTALVLDQLLSAAVAGPAALIAA